MAKKVQTVFKIQLPAGKANPAPPVGPVLGQHGLNIQDFCSQFNDATKDKGNTIIPVEVTVYEDRTYSMKYKSPPAAVLVREALGIPKGSGVPQKDKVGTITWDQLLEIGEKKKEDLNANDAEAAAKIIAGTCRSMGVIVDKK